MSEDLKCPICGKPTAHSFGNYNRYGLCIEHSAQQKKGEIEQCPDCGKWNKTGEECECHTIEVEKAKQADGKCIVCKNDAPYGSLCKDCYYEMIDLKDGIDKNANRYELKDYYFNLRANIYRMKTFDYIQTNCNKLMSIATLLKDLYDDISLTSRVVDDIKDIIQKKEPKNNESEKTTDNNILQDSHKEELIRTSDGHYVKSEPESIIDDILYETRIVHCYEKKVPITMEEKSITSDWFIPITDNRHGIYIEYWGMTTKTYLENKKRKKEAYKTHDIPLIEIEKDDYKDKMGLTDRIIKEINTLAENYYRIKDFIK